ncbi:MAG: LLM class flavin-dependent oxidoreductase [Chloroflexota bacterium]
MTVRLGLAMPPGPPPSQVGQWMAHMDTIMDAVGDHLDSFWITDHFQWDDRPTYEAWTLMTYLAARYPTMKVGTAVLGQSYRNPAMLAKMAATLQMLSGGRLIFGLGAGWKEDEYHAYDYPYPRPGIRLEQLDDALEIITRLWKEPGQVTYTGKHYSVTDAWCEPKPDPIPQIIVGGGGKKTTMLAARFADGWNIPDSNIDTYRERLAILQGHCATIGRDPASIELSWFGRLAVGKTEEEALAMSNGKWNKTNALVGTPEQVIAMMREFTALGVELFQAEVLNIEEKAVQSMIFNEIMPKLAK